LVQFSVGFILPQALKLLLEEKVRVLACWVVPFPLPRRLKVLPTQKSTFQLANLLGILSQAQPSGPVVPLFYTRPVDPAPSLFLLGCYFKDSKLPYYYEEEKIFALEVNYK